MNTNDEQSLESTPDRSHWTPWARRHPWLAKGFMLLLAPVIWLFSDYVRLEIANAYKEWWELIRG